MGVDGAWWLPRPSKPLWDEQNVLGVFDSHAFPPFNLFITLSGDKMKNVSKELNRKPVRLTCLTEKGG